MRACPTSLSDCLPLFSCFVHCIRPILGSCYPLLCCIAFGFWASQHIRSLHHLLHSVGEALTVIPSSSGSWGHFGKVLSLDRSGLLGDGKKQNCFGLFFFLSLCFAWVLVRNFAFDGKILQMHSSGVFF